MGGTNRLSAVLPTPPTIQEIAYAVYHWAQAGWVVVAGTGGSGVTTLLHKVVGCAVEQGAFGATPVFWYTEPMDYGLDNLWVPCRQCQDPFVVLDGAHPHHSAFLRALPEDKHGVVGLTASSPARAWDLFTPQREGVRPTLLWVSCSSREAGRQYVLLTGPNDGVASARIAFPSRRVHPQEATPPAAVGYLADEPPPAPGLVQVRMQCRFDGSRHLLCTAHRAG